MIARLLNYANIIYILVVFLFLQDVFTNVDISFQPLKTGVYWGIMILSPIMLIFNSFIKINLGKKIALILISIFMLTFIFVIKPINILFASGVWETREVLFRNTNNNRTIELQIQDRGALGYNKRTVEVLHLTPLFLFAKKAPQITERNPEWILVE